MCRRAADALPSLHLGGSWFCLEGVPASAGDPYHAGNVGEGAPGCAARAWSSAARRYGEPWQLLSPGLFAAFLALESCRVAGQPCVVPPSKALAGDLIRSDEIPAAVVGVVQPLDAWWEDDTVVSPIVRHEEQ